MDHSKEAFYGTDLMTITRHVLNEQSKHPEARSDFTILLSHIVLGCKYVCSAVNKAGFAKLIGLAGNSNVQGEKLKKLEVLSNEVFVKALISSGRTIFGIYMAEDQNNPSLGDVLGPGKNMVAAGHCLYGSSCMLVLGTGCGVNGFTLDPSLEDFILTHPNIKIPKTGNIYSVNEGNTRNWHKPTAKDVENCKFPHDGSSPKSLGYIGSIAADIHRTLLYGGIFMYHGDKKSPNGKLRVLYEAFPMSYLMEQAEGQAFTGKQRALSIGFV